MHPVLLVMGTAGSGKSTLGELLAERLEATFLEGDQFHPEENIARMEAGKPLNDEMRWPWLDRIAEAAADARQTRPVIIACSALKRSYRERLRAGLPGLVTIYPDAPKDLVAERMGSREGHFMPLSLLDSQFDTLEVPGDDEDHIAVSARRPPEEMADAVLEAWRAR
ncbi:gluconokinase [Oceanicola granulosus]|nr:gluconokinase [Oceanicola granulosus]